MITTASPSWRKRSITPSNASTSCGARALVGSSRITMRDSEISTRTSLDDLALREAQVADECVGIDVEAEPLRGLHDACPSGSGAHATGAGRQLDVLEHRERRDEAEVLEHHADAVLAGVVRRPDPDDLAVDPDLALVGVVDPVEDLHQRALAGAVLTEQRVHLAGEQIEVDVVVGDQRPEALRDAAGAQQRNPAILGHVGTGHVVHSVLVIHRARSSCGRRACGPWRTSPGRTRHAPIRRCALRAVRPSWRRFRRAGRR